MRRNQVQHLHVHFGTNVAAIARLIHCLGGPPYSFTVHGPTEFDAAIGFDLAGKVREAAFVVAITDYCSAQLRRWVPIDQWEKIHLVRCTVGEEFFRSDSAPINDAAGFVSIGRLSPQKGHFVLIEALAHLVRTGRDTNVVFVGDGELRSDIVRYATDLGVVDRVTITGFVPETAVRERIAAARALVMPSFAEGLPMVIMESFAVGRPVISTYVAGIPELVRPGENGWLVPAGNVAELADAMIEALDTPVERLQQMAAKGRDRTRRRHLTETEVDHLERILIDSVGVPAPLRADPSR